MKYLPGRRLQQSQFSFLFNRLIKPAGTISFLLSFFLMSLLFYFLLKTKKKKKNFCTFRSWNPSQQFSAGRSPPPKKSQMAADTGKGIIESGWICGVLAWGSDNPKLCLIARVKMVPVEGVALAFIKAVWRGIGPSIRPLPRFCFRRCYSGFVQIWALRLLHGLIVCHTSVRKLCMSSLIWAPASNN